MATYPPTGGAAYPPSAGGGGGGGGSPALMASTVGGFGGGPFSDGQLAVIRVGTWPDTEYIELFRDGSNSQWITTPRSLMTQSDINYMQIGGAALSYVGSNLSGTNTGAIGWTTKPIRRAAELYTAGLKLQIRASVVFAGNAGNAATLRVRFFNHADGDTVTFSSDGSTALAEIAAITSPATATIIYRAVVWQDIFKINTATPLTSTDVTKANLWPRLYGSIPASTGQEIDLDVEYRWVA